MDSLTIKHLAKSSQPLGVAFRAATELCELYPHIESLLTVKKRIRAVSRDLKLFVGQKTLDAEKHFV